MLILFAILVILASVVLGFFVLIQNPKGGGLSSGFGGIGNQLMGVKQTTDVLEKGTWMFAAVVGLLCILSPVFIPKSGGSTQNDELIKGVSPQSPKQNTTQMPAAPTQPDTNKAK
jgi:preprotein translocase subunit SecG